MYCKIHHPLKAIALVALLFFMVVSCKQSNGGTTNKTPLTTTNSTSNINTMAQNGDPDSGDTTPQSIANEPPPPPPPSPSGTPYATTPYSRAYLDSVETKGMAIGLKSWHISGVKATVVNNIVTLTGNANKKDLRLILDIANQHRPKAVINKLTIK